MVGSRLNLNLNDPDDVRKKLPKVRAALEEKQREVDAWSNLVKTLEFIAGADASASPKDTSSPRQSSSRRNRSAGARGVRSRSQSPAKDAVVRVVTEQNRPMRAAEVAEVLGGHRNPISAAMWGAAKAGRLQALGEGQYAPPGWQPAAEQNLLASSNGSEPGAEAELPSLVGEGPRDGAPGEATG